MRAWMHNAVAVPLLATVIGLAGCADDLRNGANTDAGLDDESRVTNTDNGDGTTTTQVNASEDAVWVYVDLESKSEVTPASADDDASWDLGFQRFKVKTNGGVSGTGNMEVAVLPEQDFDALTEAPGAGYITDQADSEDDDEDPDFAFNSGDGWYNYNPTDHTLSPRDVVYVVRSVEGNYYKLQFTEYYDGAGTSGFPTLRWGAVDPPSTADATQVDASDVEKWVYVSFASGGTVSVTDPATSTDWDLALRRTQMQTNGRTSGAGLGAARIVPEGATYEATDSSPTIGFAADEMLPLPGPPGSGEFSGNPVLNDWYNYNSTTHEVSTKGEVYLVRTAAGEYGKLQILGYDGGVFTLRFATVTRSVAVQTSVVDASDAAAWVYLSFRLGDLVTVADPATETGWDFGLSRTRLQTNNGTSGSGLGGAIDPGAVTLADVTTAPSSGYTVDEMLPLPGPPGSGEFSGNAVLNGWYDYNPTTHVTTPKDMAFVVRTADEGFVKLKITDYAGGVLTIDWAYAGAGQTGF